MYAHTLYFPLTNFIREMIKLHKDFGIGRVILYMDSRMIKYKILSHQPLRYNFSYRKRLSVMNARFAGEVVDEMTAEQFDKLFEGGVLKDDSRDYA